MAKCKSNLVDDMEYCMVCGKPNAECHHVFFGTYKKKMSDKYKMYVPLCAEHHRGNNSPHMNREIDLALKIKGQKWFEENIGTREFFMHEFGKSYL